jgi:hypothetical protein
MPDEGELVDEEGSEVDVEVAVGFEGKFDVIFGDSEDSLL